MLALWHRLGARGEPANAAARDGQRAPDDRGEEGRVIRPGLRKIGSVGAPIDLQAADCAPWPAGRTAPGCRRAQTSGPFPAARRHVARGHPRPGARPGIGARDQSTALDRTVGVIGARVMHYAGGGRAALPAPARHLTRVGQARASGRETGPTITAVLEGGPLGGRRIDVDVVEGRPPKTIDVRADDASTCRYCLADWVQTGPSAVYTYLYRV